jgi:Ca2+-binding EF-hand superfamily protein
VATEDIPSSRGENASSPSDHKSSSEGLPEEQPPTVDKDLEHTIMNLNGLLGKFFALDDDGDNALKYYEFSKYSGNTPTAGRIFHAMDSDRDGLVTYSEIMDTIHILEQQSTEGTEDVPVGNHPEEHVTTPYTDQDVIPPGTQTQPAEPTPLGVSENGPPGGDGGPRTTDTDHDTTGTVGPTSGAAGGATTTTTSPDMAPNGASSSPESDDGTVSEADESTSDSGSEGKTNEGEAGETVAGEDEEKSDEQMKKEEGALVTLTAIQQTFDELDMNRDGRLSDYEFSTFFPQDSPTVANIFSFLDVDGNFFVTSDELSMAITALEQELPPKEDDEDETTTQVSPEEELADYIHGGNNF